jgi:hypothetical protein
MATGVSTARTCESPLIDVPEEGLHQIRQFSPEHERFGIPTTVFQLPDG